MYPRLNTQRARESMQQAGLSQSAVASQLQVPEATVSQWLGERIYPGPLQLLGLAKLLKLRYTELVMERDDQAPIIAFRRARGTRTHDHHVEKAQDMGRLLRHLAPRLPQGAQEAPLVESVPAADYSSLQAMAAQVRRDLGIGLHDRLDFQHLVGCFTRLQAVLIPVLWGDKQRHENALHIYLPDSETTWVYLNLDVNVHDFKFWMAHELGHCLAPGLRGEAGEDFADRFAGALLFPQAQAQESYQAIKRCRTDTGITKVLFKLAVERMISPYAVYMETASYAEQLGDRSLALPDGFHPQLTRFNQRYPKVSALLLGGAKPQPRDFITMARDQFATPFFDLLASYLRDTGKSYGFVQTVLDLPLLDAKGIHAELTQCP